MDEGIRLILRANQLIIRDREWNNKIFEVQAKITDLNISKLLNPETQKGLAERTHESLKGEGQ